MSAQRKKKNSKAARKKAAEKARNLEQKAQAMKNGRPAPEKKPSAAHDGHDAEPAAKAVPEAAAGPAQEPIREPVPKTGTRRLAACRDAGKYMQLVHDADSGDHTARYVVKVPDYADLKYLFDAIRKDRRDEHGTVYVQLGPFDTGDASLSYSYANGVFTRNEKPSKDKSLPLLADLLGVPVTSVRASGGWGSMDYHVHIRRPGKDDVDASGLATTAD